MSLMKIGGYGINDYQTFGTISVVARALNATAGTAWQSLGSNIVLLRCAAAHGWSFTPTSPELPVAFVKFSGAVTGTTGTGSPTNQVFRVIAIGNGSNTITVGGTTTTLANTDVVIYSTVSAITFSSTPNLYPCYFPYYIAASLTTTASPNAYNSVSTTYTPFNASQGSCTVSITSAGGTGSSNVGAFYDIDNSNVINDSTTGNTLSTAPNQNGYVQPQYLNGRSSFGPQDYLIVNAANATQTAYIAVVA